MHLLRVDKNHRETSIDKPPVLVIGERKRSRLLQPFRSSWRWTNASRSDRGRAVTSTAGTRRARATFQNGVCGNCSRQKTCHRAMVRRSAPKSRFSSRTRRGEGPCRMAASKMTTAPRYTFRPRNRTDGGVILFLQPSRSQQKLSLQRYDSGRSSGPPRGFRG